MTIQEELEHSGVLGMKWGVRKARAAKARLDRDKQILDARTKDHQLKSDVKTAKAVYKKATLENGKEEAYKALLTIKDVRMSNLKIANKRTNKEQMMDAFFGPYLYNQKA